MDYAALPWLMLGGLVVFLLLSYAVVRIVVRAIRFLLR